MLHDLYPEIEDTSLNPYPTWVGDRGQADANPYVEQALPVQYEPRMGMGPHASPVDLHRIEGETLPPGRVLTHPSRIAAPLLLCSNQPQTFNAPHYIMSSVPNPIVQRSFGQYTVTPADTAPRIPKQMPSYSTDALSQQELADAAALRVRQALYGR